MADFAEIRRLHRLLDEEDAEEGEPFDLSPPFACGGHDDEIHPSGGVLDSCDTRFDSLLELDESPTLDRSGDRDRMVEDSDQRYMDQVDLVLDLFDRFSSTQLDSPTNSSFDGSSGLDFEGDGGDNDLGSDYFGLGLGFRFGLGLGFDSGDWRRFSEQDYEEDDRDVICDRERSSYSSLDDGSLVDEELRTPDPEGFTSPFRTFVSDRYVIECGETSVMVCGESGSVDALSANFDLEASDVVTADGNSCEGGDFRDGIDGFGFVGLESDSDEEAVDPHEVVSPILSMGSDLDMDDPSLDVDDRSESDTLSNDFGVPLRWDSLHLDDRRDPNDEFEWEEVDGIIDEGEVLSQADSIYEERMVVDYAEERSMPSEIWEDHESSGVEAASVEAHPAMGTGSGDDAVETMENLEWAVLLAVNDLEASNSDNMVHDTEFYTGDHEDFVYTAEYEILLGQFADTENMPMGAPPASKAFMDNLVSVFLTQADFDNARNHCTVCEENITREELVKRLPCSHCYHGDCILPWLRIRNTCPVCRYQLPTDDPDYERWRAQNQQ